MDVMIAKQDGRSDPRGLFTEPDQRASTGRAGAAARHAWRSVSRIAVRFLGAVHLRIVAELDAEDGFLRRCLPVAAVLAGSVGLLLEWWRIR